jgi:RHS repeat-associated protein
MIERAALSCDGIDVSSLVGVSGKEAMGALPAFRVDVTSPDSAVDLKGLLGQDAALVLGDEGGAVRRMPLSVRRCRNVTTWEYERDLLVRRRAPDGLLTEYRHDGFDSLVEVRYPSGASYAFGYDARGRLTELVGPDGLLAALRYDSHDNVAEEQDGRGAKTFYGYESLGRPRLRIDALGRQTTVQYDVLRQPARVTYPDGSTSSAEFEPLGKVGRFVDALGQVTEMHYAGTGVLARLVEPDGRAWLFDYDSDERLTQIRNPRQERYRFEYNRAGFVEFERPFDGRVLEYGYDQAERLVRIGYPDETWREFLHDKLGNVIEEHSPHGGIVLECDPLGRLARAKLDDAWGAVEATFERDHLGRIVSETQEGRTIRYRYDSRGRRTERVLPDGQTTRYQYDNGRRGELAAVEHDGHKIGIERDALGRETRRHVYESGVDVWSGYDAMDRLAAQRVTGRAEKAQGGGETGWDGGGARRGAPTTVGAPATGGPTPGLQAQAAYRILSERRWSYDALGRPTRIDDSRWGTTSYKYDRISQLVEARRGRYHEVFEYDGAGSLVGVLHDLAEVGEVKPWDMDAGNVLVSTNKAEYEHDRRHRRTARIEIEKVVDGSRTERRTEYDWDCRDRLREVRLPDGQSVRFRYDAFGRRVSKDVLPPGRGHFAKSLVMALEKGVEALPKIQRIEFLWDGNVLAADIGAVGSVRAQSGGEAAVGDTPDDPGIDSTGAHISLGAKIAREIERQRLGLAQPGDDGADPWAAAGRHVRVFVHEPGTFVPMLQLEGQSRELFVYVCDHLGMPKELVDTKGRLAWAATHSAWGRVLETWRESGTRLGVESPFRLLGQYEDAETGLCHTRYRYFDAETGRWCSPDPLGIVGGRNLLGFDGAPSVEVDPWGLCPQKGSRNPRVRRAAETGQEAHRQIERDLAGKGYRTEATIDLPSGQRVRKDARSGSEVVIIKPDTPSGRAAAARRAELMRQHGYDPTVVLYDPTDPAYQPGSPTYIGPGSD